MRSENLLLSRKKQIIFHSIYFFVHEVKVLQNYITFILLHETANVLEENPKGTDMCGWRFAPEILPKSAYEWNRKEKERTKKRL